MSKADQDLPTRAQLLAQNNRLRASPEKAEQTLQTMRPFGNIPDHERVEVALGQSEARYRSLVEVSPDAIFVNRDNQIVLVNQAALELFGVASADQILGKTPFDLFHPDYHAQIGERIQKMFAGGSVPVVEEKIVRPDGTLRLVEVAAASFEDAEGPAIQVILHDITKRQAREKELQNLNRTLMALSNINQAMLRSQDETSYLDEVCRIVVRDCGHTMVWIGLAEQDEGKTVRPVAYAGFEEGYLETLKITWSDSERGRGPTGTAIRTGQVSMCRNMLTDPRFRPWRQEAIKRGYASSIVLPLMSDSKALGAITIYSREPDPFSESEVALLSELSRDLSYGITTLRTRLAHVRAEQALQASEARYHTLFNSMTDGFALHEIICDEQGQPCDFRFLEVNPAFEALTGLMRKDVVGKNHNQVLPNDSPRWVQEYGAVALTGQPIHFENYSTALKRYYSVHAYRPATGQFAVIFEDITERKQMDNELQKARAKAEEHANELNLRVRERTRELSLANAYNRSLIEASLDPLVTITPAGKIGDVNAATEMVTGRARHELIGTDFHAYFSAPEKARAGYQKVFEAGSVRDYELEIRHKDGHVTPVLYNASVYRDEAGQTRGVFAVARDISDRKQFEAKLMQAEKFAIVGRMVGSVTHEINNPLQTIKNCLYLIQQDTFRESSVQEPLEMAMSETTRLTNLVGQLRELYRPRTDLQAHPQELLDLLDEVHALLTPHLNNSKIQWKPLIGLTRCYINCVRDQILEVFLNISMNAIEVMQSSGGVLSVDMHLLGEQVGVVFRDSGPGISPEILPHLFEPFMTTKNSGLGLGLSISYAIIQRHGGQIVVESHPDCGASFTVWLPMARKS